MAPRFLDVSELAGVAELDLPVVLAEKRQPALRFNGTENSFDQERVQSVHDNLGHGLSQVPGNEPRGEVVAGRLTGRHSGHQIIAARDRKPTNKDRTRDWHGRPGDGRPTAA